MIYDKAYSRKYNKAKRDIFGIVNFKKADYTSKDINYYILKTYRKNKARIDEAFEGFGESPYKTFKYALKGEVKALFNINKTGLEDINLNKYSKRTIDRALRNLSMQDIFTNEQTRGKLNILLNAKLTPVSETGKRGSALTYLLKQSKTKFLTKEFLDKMEYTGSGTYSIGADIVVRHYNSPERTVITNLKTGQEVVFYADKTDISNNNIINNNDSDELYDSIFG